MFHAVEITALAREGIENPESLELVTLRNQIKLALKAWAKSHPRAKTAHAFVLRVALDKVERKMAAGASAPDRG